MIRNRYEIREPLGSGGMGVVYIAYDTLMRRDVALKTIRDVPSSVFIDFFHRECSVLATMAHPNIVEIFDMGDFEENGISKPFFVMPLLRGRTLYDLIHPAKLPLPTNRCIDIICQTCRGLQAAHEQGLVHRDIKPRNIFVMQDDAVKIIDFGIAHLLGSNSTGVRGTPPYMSPEQLSYKPLTNRSDIFSLATVCYEALTATNPFARNTDAETANAILDYTPVLATEMNPSVSRAVSQVVARGMAKDPWLRFESAAAFADHLQKALRNELGPSLSAVNLQSRLERARRSFGQGDYEFASEIVRELESEGHSDAEVAQFRRELDEAVRRQASNRLIEAAKRYYEEEEYTLALRKIQEVLDVDALNSAALALKKSIEDVLTEQKVSELLRTAREHLEKAAFTTARQMIQDALRLHPNDTRAKLLLNEVDLKQKELLRQRQEQERLYQAAQAAWLEGKIEAAIETLEQLAEITRQSGDMRERVNEYKEFYRRVRTEHGALKSALEQGQKRLQEQDLAGAQRLCERYLSKYPNHPDFIELTQQIEVKREELAAAYRRSVAERLANEPQLPVQIEILEDAVSTKPDEVYFQEELQKTKVKLQKVETLVQRAGELEASGAFAESIEQWQNLLSFYPVYPGLEGEIARVRTLLEEARARAKENLLSQIQESLEQADHTHAASLLQEAALEFLHDPDFERLETRREQQVQTFSKVNSLLEEGVIAAERARFDEALSTFRQATELSREGVQKLRDTVFSSLLQQAQKSTLKDWRSAESMLQEASRLNLRPIPDEIWRAVRFQQREEAIANVISEATQEESKGHLSEALERLQRALETYPEEARLQTRFRSVESALAKIRLEQERAACRRALGALRDEWEQSEDPGQVEDILLRVQSVVGRFVTDPEITPIIIDIGEQVSVYEQASAALAKDLVKECQRLCDVVLTRKPEHCMFLRLKGEAAVRERELAVAYLRQVEERLSAEPDLPKRIQILTEAVGKYPEELYFREGLTLVQNEQNLVNAIVERAQGFEKAELFAEALEQWKYLQTVYPAYPGLQEAIARCAQNWQEQRDRQKAGWIDQIQKAIGKRDYSAVSSSLKKAELEFPDDEQLLSLRTLLNERLQKRSDAEQLVAQGRKELERSRFLEGQEHFRKAVQSAPDEPDIAQTAAKQLLQYSREALRTDWRLAESMVGQAQSIDPSVKFPRELQAGIAEARKKEDLDESLNSIRSFEAKADFTAALEAAHGFLARYPGHKQMQAIQSRLISEQEQLRRREERDRQLAALKAFQDQSNTVTNTETILELLKRTRQIAKQNSQDQELTRLAEEVGETLSALAQIRVFLRADKLAEAEKLCRQSASKFPQHPGFPELLSEIESRQGEMAANYLRDVEQRLASEHDWNKQAQILEEALRLYPEEAYYSDELALLRNKQNLLNAYVARAREFEAKQLFEDAVREWEALRAMYPWFPGIENELQRVLEAWRAQKAAVRDEWIRRILQALDLPDFDKAAELIKKAAGDLPDEPKLDELGQQLQEAWQRYSQAHELLREGQNLLAVGNIRDGSEALCKSLALLPGNQKLQASISELFIQYARQELHNKDWRTAQALVNRLRSLCPECNVPADLSDAIARAEYESELTQFLAQLHQAESHRDRQALFQLVSHGRAHYSTNPEAKQKIESAASLIKQIELEQSCAEALQSLSVFRRQIESASKKKQLLSLRGQIQAENILNSAHPQVRDAVAEVIATINAKIEAITAPRPHKPVLTRKAPLVPAVPLLPVQALKRPWVITIFTAVLLLAGILLWWVWPRSPINTLTSININCTPDRVSLKVDGFSCITPDCKLKLGPGQHNIYLSKDGYEPQTIPVLITPGAPTPTLIATLIPVSPAVQIVSSLSGGEVYLDGNRIGALEGSEFGLQTIAPGKHVLRVAGGNGEVSIPIAVSSDTGPILPGSVTAKDLSVAAVASNTNSGLFATNLQTQQAVSIDGQRAGYTKDGVLPLPKLSEGAHRIQMGDGKDRLSFDMQVRAKPLMYVFIAGNQNVGTLVVNTNIPGAQIFINNKQYLGPSNSSFSRIPLPAQTYQIRAVREGYSDFGPAQISVVKGTDTNLKIVLNPKPSNLEISGAVPGIQVRLDGSLLGTTVRNKPLGRSVSPGRHVINLSQDGFITKQVERQFEPGQSIRLAGADVQLQSIPVDKTALESQDWNRVSSSRAIGDLQEFVRKYPAGPHVGNANARIQQIQWESLDKESSKAIQGFLNAYPQGPYSSQARELLQTLSRAERSRAEQSDWTSVDKDSKEALQAYLLKYPDGSHTIAAQQRIAELARKAQAAEAEKAEDAAWRAVNQKDKSSLERFLQQFPGGKHSSQAQQDLNSLRTETPSGDSTVILRTIQQFANAWDTKDLDTLMALQPNLNRRNLKSNLSSLRSIQMSITPLSNPSISGDRATVSCRRKVGQVFMDGVAKQTPETVITVVLMRQPSGTWIIESAQ